MGRSLDQGELDRYDHVARPVAERARLHRVPALAPGSSGMTVGRHVLLRRGHEDRAPLIAHELVHAQQYALRGTGRFLTTYLRDYAANLARLRRHRPAYLAIPAEEEARALTDRWSERAAAT